MRILSFTNILRSILFGEYVAPYSHVTYTSIKRHQRSKAKERTKSSLGTRLPRNFLIFLNLRRKTRCAGRAGNEGRSPDVTSLAISFSDTWENNCSLQCRNKMVHYRDQFNWASSCVPDSRLLWYRTQRSILEKILPSNPLHTFVAKQQDSCFFFFFFFSFLHL